MQKIISGDYRYVLRVSRSYYALGFRVVKFKRWSDGKFTAVMEVE